MRQQKISVSCLNLSLIHIYGVEIHAVHEGYTLDQFAIANFNYRTDQYGGSLENRLRFATDIVKEIKKEAGADFPVSLRYSVVSKTKDFFKGCLLYTSHHEGGAEGAYLAADVADGAGHGGGLDLVAVREREHGLRDGPADGHAHDDRAYAHHHKAVGRDGQHEAQDEQDVGCLLYTSRCV